MAVLRRQETVCFANPDTNEPVVGRVLEHVWAKEPEEFEEIAPEDGGWRQTAGAAQLIEWPDGHKSVRFTYWARKAGTDSASWYFAGQYALSLGLEEFRSLTEALRLRAW
jgi:hypothetical protein